MDGFDVMSSSCTFNVRQRVITYNCHTKYTTEITLDHHCFWGYIIYKQSMIGQNFKEKPYNIKNKTKLQESSQS